MKPTIPEASGAELRIGIIGLGASGTALFHHLARLLPESHASGRKIEIHCFEKSGEIGCGLAYQKDLSCVLLNRPLEDMSIDPENPRDFRDWASAFVTRERVSLQDPIYLPRWIFGRYLAMRFEKAMAQLHRKGHEPRIYLGTAVTRIEKVACGYTFPGISENTYGQVVVATGNWKPQLLYGLCPSQDRYLHEPYPLKDTLRRIGSRETVMVLGSSLTAIDVLSSLDHIEHTGPVYFLSRTGNFPTVRGVDSPYSPRKFTFEWVERLRARSQGLTLKELLKRFRLELEPHGISWRDLFFRTPSHEELTSQIKQQFGASRTSSLWFDILRETHPVLDAAWELMDDAEKLKFVRLAYPNYLFRRASVPPVNAEKVVRNLDSGRLRLIGGLRSVTRLDVGFEAVLESGCRIGGDWLVNATGPSRNYCARASGGLEQALVYGGLAKTDAKGGLLTDFKSGRLIDSDGQPSPGLRILGHGASGTYFIVNNFEFLTRLSRDFARQISAELRQLRAHAVQGDRGSPLATSLSWDLREGNIHT